MEVRDTHPVSRRVGCVLIVFCLLAAFLNPWPAWAVDTVEPFEQGTSDVELYLGSDGLGRSANETTLRTSFQLGYGLTKRLSAYLNGNVSSDTFFRGGDRGLRLGLYGNVLDTRHFDVDLFLDLGLYGDTLASAGVAPGIELNLDIDRFGVFVMLWEIMSGRETSPAAPAGEDRVERVFDTELALGGYWNVSPGHQVLLLFDSVVHHVPEQGQTPYEIGGVALGYNVMLHDNVELINEVRVDLPQDVETAAFGVSTGILVTLR